MRPAKPVKPPEIAAPGLAWRPLKNHWVAWWVARPDLVKRRYQVKGRRLWPSSEALPTSEPSPDDWRLIGAQCELLQGEMLQWAHGGLFTDPWSIYDGTMESLVKIYQVDKDSPFQELRHETSLNYASRLRRIAGAIGKSRLADLGFRDLKRWHEGFRDAGGEQHISSAHGLMGQIKLVVKFGKQLELPDCARLYEILKDMEFEGGKKRVEFVDYHQSEAICAEAHRQGWHSVALAQAFMFELMIRQKDAIGEWLPLQVPGTSDVVWHGKKWLLGLHWRDISPDLMLTKVLSKSLRGRRALVTPGAGKVEQFDLNIYPLIVAELGRLTKWGDGPLIVCESTSKPWKASHFRDRWRRIARAAGIPDNVQNRDSRAGGITEATDAIAVATPDFEAVRRHAGHSQGSTTARYSRSHVQAKNGVEMLRIRSREEKS